MPDNPNSQAWSEDFGLSFAGSNQYAAAMDFFSFGGGNDGDTSSNDDASPADSDPAHIWREACL